ncbi:MAG TPA: DUF427 domain-containing protein [Acidimicrobiales bacterium]|jgi:uncharacterized protein (DUF427 family)
MGLAWQQGPLATVSIGHFLIEQQLPERLLFAEPLRRRMRVKFGADWIADSEDVILLHEPGRYPVAYFRQTDVCIGVLEPSDHVTSHKELGVTTWFAVRSGDRSTERAAWAYSDLPSFASVLGERVAFAWRAMDAFYEEDERIVGHAADAYHRIDIRQTSRHFEVKSKGRTIADTTGPLALYESGFAPRWYVPSVDVDLTALKPLEMQTFCPYKGLCSHFEIDGIPGAVWSYREPFTEVNRISGMFSFEPDKVTVTLDGVALRLEPGQTVVPHGPDRDLTVDEMSRTIGSQSAD